jgi:microcystin-dependent protein
MANDVTQSTWSETDASNSQPAPNGWPEGMMPSGINDAARMMMGSLKRWWNRDHAGAGVTVGGTGNAITLSYSVPPTAYVQGERFAFRAGAANSGATTVNVASLGAKKLLKPGTSGPTAMIGGEIQANQLVVIDYDPTLDSSNGAFVMVSPCAIGTAAGQVLALDASAKLPAVDGSQLTNMATVPAGVVSDFAGITAPSGWLLCFGQAVSRTTFATLFSAITIALPGNTATGSPTISSIASTTGVAVGMPLSGPGIPAGATVSSLTSTSITMSANATANGTGVAVAVCPHGVGDGSTTFNVPDYRGRVGAGADDMGGSSAARLGTGLNGGFTTTVAKQIGGVGGAGGHTLVTNETPSHGHTYREPTGSAGSDLGGSGGSVATTTSTGLVGGGAAHNNVQPTIVMNKIIRT